VLLVVAEERADRAESRFTTRGVQVRHLRGIGEDRAALLASSGVPLDAEDGERPSDRFGFDPRSSRGGGICSPRCAASSDR
jgi:hypothetical protein